MAWIAGALAIGGKILGSIGDSEQHKDDQKMTMEELMQQGVNSREDSQFNADQLYYYSQLKRQDEQRGLDQFRKFTSVKDFSPNYVDTNPAVVVPTKPVYNQGAYAPTTPTSSTSNGGSNGTGVLEGLVGGGLVEGLLGGFI